MIYAPTSYSKDVKLDSVKIQDKSEIGKEHSEILNIVRKSLQDFRQKLSHDKKSFLQQDTELKLNYLNLLLKEKISNIDISEQASNYKAELTTEETKTLRTIVKDQLNGLPNKLIESAIEEIEKVLATYSKENKEPVFDVDSKIELKDVDNGDYLSMVFDQLYTKSESFDLKDQIKSQLTETHNDIIGLFKERVQKYKEMLVEYKNKVQKANDVIGKQNEILKKNKLEIIKNESEHKKEDEKKQNLIDQLTQSIVDTVRRNEKMAVAPKLKGLMPEHIDSANNLIDKFYNNAKIELKIKSIKKFFGGFGKVIGFILTPISFGIRKIFGAIESIRRTVIKLSKFVLNSTSSLFITALASPGGAYAIGFLAGFVSSYLKEKLWGDEKNEGWLKSTFEFIIDYFITPTIKIAKGLWGVIKSVINWIAEHPMITTMLTGALFSIFEAVKHAKLLKASYSIARLGFKNLGPVLLGLGASAITETIFNKTIFSSASDNAIEWYNIKNAQFHKFIGEINHQTLSELNAEDTAKYNFFYSSVTEEQKEIDTLYNALDFIQKNTKSKDLEKENIFTLMEDGFVQMIFNSKIHGMDKQSYDDFIRKFRNSNVQDQSAELIKYLGKRQTFLANIAAVLSTSSNNRDVLLHTINSFVKQETINDEKGNPQIKREFIRGERDKDGKVEKPSDLDRLWEMGDLKNQTAQRVFNELNGLSRIIDRRFKPGTDSRARQDAAELHKAQLKMPEFSKDILSTFTALGNSKQRSVHERSRYYVGMKKDEDKNNPYLMAKDITEQYLKRNGIQNAETFSQLVDWREIESIISKSSGNQQELKNNLDTYYAEVVKEIKNNQLRIGNNLKDEIKTLDDDISGLNKDLKRLNDEILYYYKEGMK